jgi:uncharacterized protein (DUF952 family)
MPTIFHATTSDLWDTAKKSGTYTVASLRDEGFIHCCTEEQIPRIVERIYKNNDDLLILCIDTHKLESQMVYEWSPSLTATFPHVYGPINLEAVTEVRVKKDIGVI